MWTVKNLSITAAACVLAASLLLPGAADARSQTCVAQFVAGADHSGLERGKSYRLRCEEPDRKGASRCELLDSSGKVAAKAQTQLVKAGGGDVLQQEWSLTYETIQRVLSEICSDRSTRWVGRLQGNKLQVEGRSAKHKDWINLLSVSQGLSRPMSAGATANRPGGLTSQGRGPQHVNPRDYEPSGLAVVGDPMPKPFLQQLGGTAATVPMKHGSCGLDCGTHVLATTSGNLDVPIKLGLTCPSGLKVTYLGFQPQGAPLSPVRFGPAPSVVKNLSIQPFSASDLESACQAALGGSWAQPNRHNNRRRTVKKTIQKSVRAWGECTGWPSKTFKDTVITLTLTCVDQDWN